MLSRRAQDRAEPLRGQSVEHLERRRSLAHGHVAHGTLACPVCDAPVVPPAPVMPREPLACPVCSHGAPARDFLSLAAPARPARVVVRIRSLP